MDQRQGKSGGWRSPSDEEIEQRSKETRRWAAWSAGIVVTLMLLWWMVAG